MTVCPTPLTINGRFLVQPQSGVQRFATEITAALIRRAARLGQPPPAVLAPRSEAPADAAIPRRSVGRRQGQVWEQWELPRHAGPGVLLNLGNTAPLAAHLWRRPQVAIIHDAGVFRRPEAYSRIFRLWYRVLHTALLHGGAAVATVSQAARQDIAECLHCDPSRIALVSEAGAHIRDVAPDPTMIARHSLTAGRFVLAVGNLAGHKNLAALGDTARMLAQRGLDLVITGSLDRAVFGRGAGALPAPAVQVGRVSDAELAALYAAAACLVFPSTYEGFGLPALEAMEMGCPVTASFIPALREVCGHAAAYFDPYDPADIARTVARLLDNPGFRDTLRTRGFERARAFTWDEAAERLAAVAEAVAAPAGKARKGRWDTPSSETPVFGLTARDATRRGGAA